MVLHQPTAKVLVVEDEMMLRMRAVDIVEDAGFMPVEAVNADDALVILESRSDIDLLFTDIQMPGTMDGMKLAHAVHARWPSIKIMLVSGQVTPTDTERPVNSRFYGKPLEVKKMIAELQEMLGEGTLRIIPADISKLLATIPSAKTPHDAGPAGSKSHTSNESLTAENDSLRLLLEQAGIDAQVLLAQAGIDAPLPLKASEQRPALSTASTPSKAVWSRLVERTTYFCRRDGPTPTWLIQYEVRQSLMTAKAQVDFRFLDLTLKLHLAP